MAGAIIQGILRANLLPAQQIGVYDVSASQCEPHEKSGCRVFDSVAELVQSCHMVVLSVKPQNFPDVLSLIRRASPASDTVFLSIAAGISIGFIKENLGFDAAVIRAMPNTPLLIGFGAVALSRETPVSDEAFDFAKSIFSSAGIAVEIPSDRMNEVIPLNGSSPAYIYLFAKIFVEQAEKAEFDPQTANRLFCETLIGSAKMMLESGKTHQQLIDMVTSPKGTTFEGLCALEEHGFAQALIACFDATVRRAYELGR